MTMKERLSKKLNALPPAKRQKLILYGTVGGLFVLMSAFVLINDKSSTKKAPAKEREVAVGNVLMGTGQNDIGLAGLSRELEEVQADLKRMRDEKARDDRNAATARANPATVVPADTPDAALESLRAQLTEERESMGPIGTTLNPGRPGVAATPGGSSSGPVAPPPPPLTAPSIHTVKAEKKPTQSKAAARFKNVYIPTGSIMSGVLLNGLDAPTGRGAQSQPIPVVVRVKHEAILPSQYSSDVREAFILAAGYGDLSSERAYLRAERLSMILKNGDVIDIPIKMSAVGNDGKSGIRGTVVSKQGSVIGKALLAGMADGVSRAFGGSYNSMSGNGLPDDRQIAIGGIGGGTSGALDRIASYFLAQAEAMYPVVEIAGGRDISFILLEGTELAPRVDEAAEKAIAAEQKQELASAK